MADYCKKGDPIFHSYCVANSVSKTCQPETCGFNRTLQQLYDENPQKAEFERRVAEHKVKEKTNGK
jgi:hypothetical protein